MNYLPIVALGTVADLVSLRGENRIIVKEGLQQLKELKITGLKVLIDELKLSQEEMTSGQIGYILAPPLNAAGRIANPTDAVNLLISDDPQYCKKIANELVKVNQDRRQEEKKIYNEAVETIENNYDLNEYSVIVLASENWHQGVIGIVASRLVEKYYLPVVMISLNENQGKASCRSINKLNLFQALEHCEEFLLGFGGHAQAAGLSISKENINSFRNKLNKYIKNKLSPTDFMPKLKLDLELELEQINFELAMKLDKLRPFGLGNPAPKFLLRDIRVSNIFTMGKENQHLKFYPCAGITAIGFGFGELALEIENKRIDLACQIEVNNWLGKKELQLKVNDINLPEDPGYLPIDFWDDNLIIADKRMTKWREKYLLNRKNQGQKIGVYINQKPLIDKLLNKEGFYKLSLIKESKEAGIYLFNKIPNEKIEVDQLILYSLPFSFAHLNKILKYVAISEKRLILLFTDEEKKINHKLIQMNLPNREFLRQLYRFLSKNKNKIFSVNDLYQQLLDKENVNKKSLQESLQIFTELNLIKKQEEELIFRESKENKLDLSDSLRYNKLSGHLLDFEQFARFAYQKNLFELMSKLKKLKEDTNEFER